MPPPPALAPRPTSSLNPISSSLSASSSTSTDRSSRPKHCVLCRWSINLRAGGNQRQVGRRGSGAEAAADGRQGKSALRIKCGQRGAGAGIAAPLLPPQPPCLPPAGRCHHNLGAFAQRGRLHLQVTGSRGGVGAGDMVGLGLTGSRVLHSRSLGLYGGPRPPIQAPGSRHVPGPPSRPQGPHSRPHGPHSRPQAPAPPPAGTARLR